MEHGLARMHTDEEGDVDWSTGRMGHGLTQMNTDKEWNADQRR